LKRILHKSKALVLSLLLCSAIQLPAQGRILHSPPAYAAAGRPLTLFCRLEEAATPVRIIRVFYRHNAEEDYKFVTMKASGDQWKGIVPASEIRGERLQYFILCALQNDAVLSYPWENPKSNPEEIGIRADAGEIAAGSPVLILSPEPDQILPPQTAFLAVSLSTPKVRVDASTVRIFVDGRDVTRHATLSDHVVTLDMKTLGEGKHEIDIHARDTKGGQLAPASLIFFVKGRRKALVAKSHFSGRVFAEGRREQIYNKDQSFAMGGGDFSGNVAGFDVQGRFFVTSLEEAGAQPRDRFYLSVGNRHFKLQAGDIYPRYNDLIMWGKRARGLAGAVQLGAVKVEALFGETYRGVEGCGQSGDPVTISRYGTYRQQLLAIRPSLNFDDNVKAGLSIVKIKDDVASIRFGANPSDNLVIGPDFSLSFDRSRIELRAQAAYSFLTRDISSGSFNKYEIENIFGTSIDVPVDPAALSGVLIINDSTVPLDPRKFTSGAFDVNLKLHYFRNLMRVGYKSIGPDYYSLANSWLRKDIRGLYFSDRLRLFRNKVYANLAVERFKDNLAGDGTKPTSDLNSLNFGFSIYPGRKLPNLNISVRDYHRTNGITDIQIDSLRIIGVLDTLDARQDSRQRDLSLQLGYQASFLNTDHYIAASYIAAIRDDSYESSRLEDYFSQALSSHIVMLSWTSTYRAPLRTTFSFATNNNILGNGLSDFRYNSISGFGEYRFYHDKMTTFAELRFLSSTGTSYNDAIVDAQRLHFRVGGTLHFRYRQTLLLEGMVITLDSQTAAASAESAYVDYLIRLRYEKLF